MTNKIFYIAPRERKQRKRPAKLQAGAGAEVLIANVIAQATNDFICGDSEHSEDARFFFMSPDYQELLSWLGLVDEMIPAALQERIVRLDG